MKHILISVALLFSTALADFNNFGDGAKVPQIFVKSSFDDDILSTTTSWLILRDNNCDKFVRTDVIKSVRGQLLDITSSCIHQRLCGNVRGPAAPVPISCDMFTRTINMG